MMTKIKLCGNYRMEDVAYINTVMPDFMGVIFVPNRRRSIDATQALKMRQVLNPTIPMIGIFQNQSMDEILKLYHQGIIQGAQLHGQETEHEVQVLKQAGMLVINVVAITQLTQKSTADYILVDHADGGRGQTVDWYSIPQKRTRPLILAGGLTTENIQQAIQIVQPTVVDISSGSERDGMKNLQLMRQLVALTRNEDK